MNDQLMNLDATELETLDGGDGSPAYNGAYSVAYGVAWGVGAAISGVIIGYNAAVGATTDFLCYATQDC